jgi:hypothetical protein
MSTLKELEERHDKQASAIVTKTLDNDHWRINANDVCWVYHDPQVNKQLGRSKRVFNRLIELNE